MPLAFCRPVVLIVAMRQIRGTAIPLSHASQCPGVYPGIEHRHFSGSIGELRMTGAVTCVGAGVGGRSAWLLRTVDPATTSGAASWGPLNMLTEVIPCARLRRSMLPGQRPSRLGGLLARSFRAAQPNYCFPQRPPCGTRRPPAEPSACRTQTIMNSTGQLRWHLPVEGRSSFRSSLSTLYLHQQTVFSSIKI